MEDEIIHERVIVHTTEVPQETIVVSRAVFYILDVIESLLAIRFLLKAFGASSVASFVRFMYSITDPLVAPFRGIFPPAVEQGLAIDWPTLVAMLVYALIAYLIIRLVRALSV